QVYAVLGDGEIEEGQVWEACMSAAKFHLDNLCCVVDVNGLQIDGKTSDVMPSEPLDKKFEAFGFRVLKVDGHSYTQLLAAFEDARTNVVCPTMILANTVKGKGVSFMENDAGWHGKAPNDEQYEVAKTQLSANLARLEGK
ncbi:MAG: transketolase, partial [Oscillospiraceae bacterium]